MASATERGVTLLPALVLLSFALAGAAVFLAYRLDAERDRNAALQAELASAEREKSALRARFEREAAFGRAAPGSGARVPPLSSAESGGAASGLAGSLPAGGSTQGAGGAAGAADARGRGPRAANRANPFSDPEQRAALRAQQVAALRRRYPDLAAELGLSPADADRFIELQVDQQMRLMEASRADATAGRASGGSEVREIARRMDEARRSADQEISAQFGSEAAKNWKAYQQNSGARMELRELQLELADAGMPLTREQRDGLVAAMVREQRAPSGAPANGAAVGGKPSWEQAEASYQRLRNAARGVLSAEQFQRFDALQRERLDRLKATSEARGRTVVRPGTN